MPTKRILILANSLKNRERCVTGDFEGHHYKVIAAVLEDC
jgi:hypothetical protein